MKITVPKYPDSLSRVCTRWRQIAMDVPTLWSHIDLVTFSSRSQGFEARAKAFAARAGSSLLDVHVYEPAVYDILSTETAEEFLTTIAWQIRSLEFLRPEDSELDDQSVIGLCFEICEPGTLTELTLLDYSSRTPTSIGGYENPNDIASALRLHLSQEELDDLLLQITGVRLDGIYFPWTNQIYQGLVELRLDSTCTSIHGTAVLISESELVNILLSSPRLRILYFGLVVQDTLPEDSVTPPVLLEYLEVLSLTLRVHALPGTFLRLLSPGSKPLHLSLIFSPYTDDALPLCASKVRDFFIRSNVSKLHINGVKSGTYQILGELACQSPNLRGLATTKVGSHPTRNPTSNHDARAAPSACLYLDTLYLIRSSIKLDTLKQLLRQYSVKRLVIWNCGGSTRPSDQLLQIKLSRLCPAVRCIDRKEPNPIEDWD